MPLCHLISAVDPIEAADNTKPIRDGLPETLPEWIDFNGLKYFKIKLNGNDLKWDLERVLHIDRVTTETQEKRGCQDWSYVLDFNEKCPECGLLPDIPPATEGNDAEGIRADRVRGTAHRTRT